MYCFSCAVQWPPSRIPVWFFCNLATHTEKRTAMPWLKMVTLFLSAPQAPPELQRRRRYLKYTSENRRFDHCVLDWTISSQSCQASNCHRRKMFLRLNQIDRQLWLPMVGGSCTDWSNLRYTGWIYDFRRYSLIFMGGVPLGRYGTYFVIFHWHQFLSNMQFMKTPIKIIVSFGQYPCFNFTFCFLLNFMRSTRFIVLCPNKI